MSEGKKEELMWSNAGFYEIDDSVFFPPCVVFQHLCDLYILSCSRSPLFHQNIMRWSVIRIFFYPFKGTVIRYTKPVILRMKLYVMEISFCVKIRRKSFIYAFFMIASWLVQKKNILTC